MISIIIIAVMYFITAYYVAEYLFKFGRQQNELAITLFLIGLIGFLLGKYYIKKDNIAYGILYGGYLLIGLSIIGNWRNINDEYKLLLIISAFIAIIMYFYRQDYYNKDNGTISE